LLLKLSRELEASLRRHIRHADLEGVEAARTESLIPQHANLLIGCLELLLLHLQLQQLDLLLCGELLHCVKRVILASRYNNSG
jgi:hypothetical protein